MRELKLYVTEEDLNKFEVGTYKTHKEKKAQNCHCRMHEMYLDLEDTPDMHRIFAYGENDNYQADLILYEAHMDEVMAYINKDSYGGQNNLGRTKTKNPQEEKEEKPKLFKDAGKMEEKYHEGITVESIEENTW